MISRSFQTSSVWSDTMLSQLDLAFMEFGYTLELSFIVNTGHKAFFCDFDRVNWDLIKEHHKLSYIHQLFNEIGEFLETRFARHWHTEIPVNDNAESSLRKRIRSTMVLGLSDLLKEDILIKCKKSYPKEFVFTDLGEIFAEFYGNIFGLHTRHVSDEDDDTPLIKFSRPGNRGGQENSSSPNKQTFVR